MNHQNNLLHGRVGTLFGELGQRAYLMAYSLFTLTFIFLFYHEMIMFIGVSDLDAVRVYFLGIAPSRDFAFLLLVIMAVWLYPEMKHYTGRRFLWFFAFLCIFASALGLLSNGFFPAFKIDIRNFSWLFAGVIWGRLMILSRMIKESLFLFLCVGVAYMVYCFIRDPAWAKVMVSVTASNRVTGDGLEQSKSILLTGLSLLMPVLLLTRRKFLFCAAASMLLVVFYIAVIIGGYKSALIHLTTLVSIVVLTALFTSSRMGFGRISMPRLILVLLTAVAAFGVGGYLIFSDQLAAVSTIKDRLLYDYWHYGTFGSRTDDLLSLLNAMSPTDYILGQGFGGYYNSPIGIVSSPHIGVFYYLQKTGVICFAIFVGFFYFYFPVRYALWALLWRRELGNIRDAMLIVGPCLLVWAFNLIFGGLFGNVSVVFLGISYALYYEICTHGSRCLSYKSS